MRLSISLFVLATLCAVVPLSCKESPKTAPNPAASSMPVVADHATAPATSVARTAAVVIEGKVVETIEVHNYTYLHIETATGKVWAAVPKAQVAAGSQVAVENAMKMSNFHSPTLNRTFEEIFFGTLRGAPAALVIATAAGSASAPPPIPTDVAVHKATGPNAFTVAEVITQSEKLNGKSVTIQAVVVKVNTGILDRNWVHVRDGSGSEADKTNDILLTTTETPKVGDVVIAKGRVATNKDFGSGYSYQVMIEEASFSPAPATARKK